MASKQFHINLSNLTHGCIQTILRFTNRCYSRDLQQTMNQLCREGGIFYITLTVPMKGDNSVDPSYEATPIHQTTDMIDFQIFIDDIKEDMLFAISRQCGYLSPIDLNIAMSPDRPFYMDIRFPIIESEIIEESDDSVVMATAPVADDDDAATDPEMPELEDDESYCLSDEEDANPNWKDLRGFNIYLDPKGLKGYYLVPPHGHPDIGTKYYLNGWWRPKSGLWGPKKGLWLFKREFVPALIEMGAVLHE